jgi:hypothetical protein
MFEKASSHRRGAGVEENRVIMVLERRAYVDAVTRYTVPLRNSLDLFQISTDEDRIRHDPIPGAQEHAPLVSDRTNRANQMLVVAHSSGDPVHDQPEPPRWHDLSTYSVVTKQLL